VAAGEQSATSKMDRDLMSRVNEQRERLRSEHNLRTPKGGGGAVSLQLHTEVLVKGKTWSQDS
jgi:hypothetical protein